MFHHTNEWNVIQTSPKFNYSLKITIDMNNLNVWEKDELTGQLWYSRQGVCLYYV